MRLTCQCKTCKTNATKLGVAKLQADVPEVVYNDLGSKARHSLVWMAFDPSVVGESDRARLGIEPVGYSHTAHDRPATLADAKARAEALIAAKHA